MDAGEASGVDQFDDVDRDDDLDMDFPPVKHINCPEEVIDYWNTCLGKVTRKNDMLLI